jgi:hypothetical protein
VADVWLIPYLPLDREREVGPWLLVPFRDLARRHTTNQPVFNEVRRLRTAYKLKEGITPFGAVVVPVDGRIGDERPRELLRPFHRAVSCALIDSNASFLDDDNPNAGHKMATAENAVVYGHPLHGGNSYVTSTGALVQSWDYRSAEPGRRLPSVAPPHELPKPLFASFDHEYASGLYTALTGEDITARRLDRAIEWLALAWSNSAAISEDARVIVLRAGLEALLGGGASTQRNRELLSVLLDESDPARTPRSWPRLKEPVDLTDLEWWFQSYAFLRNKVAHGDIVEADDWLFEDGRRHLHLADDVLRRAIKRTVVRATGNNTLEMSTIARALARREEQALAVADRHFNS